MLNETETLTLIRRAKEGSAEAKESLLTHNSCLMKSILRRYLGKGVDYDDLYQLASIGLLKAIAGFDESFGVQFSTYAVPMIAGEIKRFLRDDGTIKVSRSIKKRARELDQFVAEYTQTHDNAPSIKEIAEAFQMEESEVVFTMDSNKMPLSLSEQGEYKDEETPSLAEKLPAKDDWEEHIDEMQLKECMAKLTDRERKIVILRYFRDMTQSEVAKVIGVSQVQISRIESKVLASFRKDMANSE